MYPRSRSSLFCRLKPQALAYAIVKSETEARKSEYEDKLTPEMVYAAVSPLISATGENARTIKNKIQQVIEELLYQEVAEKTANNQGK